MSTVTFDLPPRMTVTNGLVAQFQGVNQRVFPLIVDQAINVSYAFTAQERIFNVEKDTESYMEMFGRSAVAEMGANIELNLALNAASAVPVNTIVNGQTVPTGALPRNPAGFDRRCAARPPWKRAATGRQIPRRPAARKGRRVASMVQ